MYVNNVAFGLTDAPITHLESFTRVCNKKYALIAAATIAVSEREKISCNIFEFPEAFTKVSVSYGAFPKLSQYRSVIDYT